MQDYLAENQDATGQLHGPEGKLDWASRDGGWAQSPSPGKDSRYSWLGDYLARLDGKEARRKYYAWLEQATPYNN
jgi:hypothetical protein